MREVIWVVIFYHFQSIGLTDFRKSAIKRGFIFAFGVIFCFKHI